MIEVYVGYLLAGVIAGVLAGAIGIGGGLVLVPILLLLFHLSGITLATAAVMAVGTSVTTIAITTLSSAWGHYRNGYVSFKLVTAMVPAMLVGTWAGTYFAGHLPTWLLLKLFGALCVFMAFRIWFSIKVAEIAVADLPATNPYKLSVSGFLIGATASLFGVGGGALLIPVLRKMKVAMKVAIGTAAVSSFAVAVMGTIAHASLDHVQGHVTWASGSIYWPAVGMIAITSIPCARFGTILTRKLPATTLQKLFVLFLLLVSIKFIFF